MRTVCTGAARRLWPHLRDRARREPIARLVLVLAARAVQGGACGVGDGHVEPRVHPLHCPLCAPPVGCSYSVGRLRTLAFEVELNQRSASNLAHARLRSRTQLTLGFGLEASPAHHMVITSHSSTRPPVHVSRVCAALSQATRVDDPRPTDRDGRIRQAIVSDSGPSFSNWPASAEAREVCAALLRKEPSERLTIEQLLHHPWMRTRHELSRSDAPGLDRVRSYAASQWGMAVGSLEDRFGVTLSVARGLGPAPTPPPAGAQFERLTAKLRAACFAVVIQQEAAERAAAEAALATESSSHGRRAGALAPSSPESSASASIERTYSRSPTLRSYAYDDERGRMIQDDLLSNCTTSFIQPDEILHPTRCGPFIQPNEIRTRDPALARCHRASHRPAVDSGVCVQSVLSESLTLPARGQLTWAHIMPAPAHYLVRYYSSHTLLCVCIWCVHVVQVHHRSGPRPRPWWMRRRLPAARAVAAGGGGRRS